MQTREQVASTSVSFYIHGAGINMTNKQDTVLNKFAWLSYIPLVIHELDKLKNVFIQATITDYYCLYCSFYEH